MQGLVVVEDTEVSRCRESFVCYGTLKHRTSGYTPIPQSGVAPLVGLVSWDIQLSQIGHLRFRLLPLLPDIHSEPAPQPFIPRHQCPLHIGHPEVANPATDKHFRFLHYCSNDIVNITAFYVISVRRFRSLPAKAPHLDIRLPSDSTSRWTPLPSANASYCRARSGLAPPSCCSCRAHQNKSDQLFTVDRLWLGQCSVVVQMWPV